MSKTVLERERIFLTQAQSDDGGLLVLDVRDSDEFDRCHIRQAKSYPKQLIAHDKISAELYTFKTKLSKRLVIYDGDDKSTAKVATMLVEKGFANVYALSGGFEEVNFLLQTS